MSSPADPHALVEALSRIGRAFRSQSGHAPQVIRTVHGAEHTFLATLDRLGSSRAGELAEAIGTSPSLLSRQSASLEAEGLVARRPSTADARATMLELTDVGRERLAAQREAYHEYLAELVDGWGAERTREATAVLNDLACHVSERAAPSRATPTANQPTDTKERVTA